MEYLPSVLVPIISSASVISLYLFYACKCTAMDAYIECSYKMNAPKLLPLLVWKVGADNSKQKSSTS
jgi:hypothetical protein